MNFAFLHNSPNRCENRNSLKITVPVFMLSAQESGKYFLVQTISAIESVSSSASSGIADKSQSVIKSDFHVSIIKFFLAVKPSSFSFRRRMDSITPLIHKIYMADSCVSPLKNLLTNSELSCIIILSRLCGSVNVLSLRGKSGHHRAG